MENLRERVFLVGLFWCATASATQPTPPKVQIQAKISNQIVNIQVVNQEKTTALIELYPGEQTSIEFSPTRAQLAAGQSTHLKVKVLGEFEGRQVLHIDSRVTFNPALGSVPGPSLYQPMMISGADTKPLTYEEAFLSTRDQIGGRSDQAKMDLGGATEISEIGRLAYPSKEVPPSVSIEPFRAKDLREYASMSLKQLPREIGLGQERTSGTSLDSSLVDFYTEEQDLQTLDSNLSAYGFVIKGKMSLKTAPNTYKAAWGWVVRAWQNIGGAWVFLGWNYVGSDGSWQIPLPAAFVGMQVRVEYRTKNRFVSVQDAQGNPYTWGDNWKITGSITDIGNRYANLTVNGDLPAVDKLYIGATRVWIKFHDHGLNALRDQPIQVYFPNSLSSGQCIYNNGSGPYAWSCSYWGDGRIYIIPAHGSESVVQHEIAHSINSYYWDGKMPPGSGGSHNLWNCYNNGLALTEGFANFVTYWTQFSRGTAAPVASYFNMNLENLPAGVCSNQTAEMRVAATFWDMYDTIAENINATAADGLYYINQGIPVSLYLNSKKNSMLEYLPVVHAGQSSFWQNEFTKVFKMNKILP